MRLRSGWAAGRAGLAGEARLRAGRCGRLAPIFAGNRAGAGAREGGRSPSRLGLGLGRPPSLSPGLGSSTDPVSWGFSVSEVRSGRARAAHSESHPGPRPTPESGRGGGEASVGPPWASRRFPCLNKPDPSASRGSS